MALATSLRYHGSPLIKFEIYKILITFKNNKVLDMDCKDLDGNPYLSCNTFLNKNDEIHFYCSFLYKDTDEFKPFANFGKDEIIKEKLMFDNLIGKKLPYTPDLYKIIEFHIRTTNINFKPHERKIIYKIEDNTHDAWSST